MRHAWLVRAICFLCLIQCLTAPAWAYKRETRIPLLGCRGHFAASGNARFVEVRSERSVRDHDELIIDIKNVPLRPGTVLVVYVSNEAVGNITINSKLSGSLTLKAEGLQYLPSVNLGTSVVLTKLDGSLVLW
jgi:hypothetical protein